MTAFTVSFKVLRVRVRAKTVRFSRDRQIGIRIPQPHPQHRGPPEKTARCTVRVSLPILLIMCPMHPLQRSKKSETKLKELDGRVECKLTADNHGRSEWWLLLERVESWVTCALRS